MSVTISSTIKHVPSHPYAAVAEAILGTRYTVSLVFIGATRAKTLNQTTRGKEYIPNVLSFELDQRHGEIYICPIVAAKEAAKFDLTPHGYVLYLFIHGCLHLKGHPHGPAMDRLEQKYIRQFSVH